MQDTHVYEVVGEVLFRRSGNGSRTILRCKIVRTRAMATVDENGAKAMIAALVSGYWNYRFTEWFKDWTALDDLSDADFQSGRPIDIAIPVEVYDHMLATGNVPHDISIVTAEGGIQYNPFTGPVTAVKIDDRWVEPEPIRAIPDLQPLGRA